MKTRSFLVAAFCLAIPLISSIGTVLAATQQQFYVSPNGNDANAGTSLTTPLKTLAGAKSKVRTFLASNTITGDIVVFFRNGTYPLTSAVAFDPADSGKNGFKVIYQAYQLEKPVFDGGVAIPDTAWTTVNLNGNSVRRASVSGITDTRQFYLNGRRKSRASTEIPIYAKRWQGFNDGLVVESTRLPVLRDPANVEVSMTFQWRHYRFPVDGMSDLGNGETLIDLNNTFSSVARGFGPDGAKPQYSSLFHVENSLDLLDTPGEWFYDKATSFIYYYPIPGETLTKAIIPKTESMMTITGTSLTAKVQNLEFRGLRFVHGGWIQPSSTGVLEWAAGRVRFPNANNRSIFGHIVMRNAQNITFSRCVFEHMGGIPLKALSAVHNLKIEGNIFAGLASGAIMLGYDRLHLDANTEVPSGAVITNNLIRNFGLDYYTCAGIRAMFMENGSIRNNSIANGSYMGIAIGLIDLQQVSPNVAASYLVKNNIINWNRVEFCMQRVRDGGGIYAQGAAFNSQINNNHIKAMHGDPGGIYLDNNAGNYLLQNNVIEEVPLYLFVNDQAFNNTFRNIYTTSDEFKIAAGAINTTVNGINIYTSPSVRPAAATTVVNGAGLESGFSSLNSYLPNPTNKTPTTNAGADRTINLNQSIRLDGSMGDDGWPYNSLRSKWTVTAKPNTTPPATVTFDHSELLDSRVSFSHPGIYTLELTADDGRLTRKDSVVITVTNASTGTLISQARPITSNVTDTTNNKKASAVDGNGNTFWTSMFSSNQYLQVDLGTGNLIKRIEILADDDPIREAAIFTRRNFSIHASNSSSFSTYTILGGQGSDPFAFKGTWVLNVNSSTNFRYIRFTNRDENPGTIQAAEFRVFK